MISASESKAFEMPSIAIDVVEPSGRCRRGRLRCEIGKDIRFNVATLGSYFRSAWKDVVYDALLVAAAVEFSDKCQRRRLRIWGRNIELRIPVHSPDLWNSPPVSTALHQALMFLTGDCWSITFYARAKPEISPVQEYIQLEFNAQAIVPFSDGMDSRAVAGIEGRKLGDALVRVRLGSQKFETGNHVSFQGRFTSIPFNVCERDTKFVESSVRSRGFKFSIISGLAAHLAHAHRVIVPESGQGAIGPSLISVGQAYGDFRNSPRFTVYIERFFDALLGYKIQYEFPRIWHTKGETIRQYCEESEGGAEILVATRSCWMGNRQVSVGRRKRQCGMCAACLLRRMSVHSAGLTEPQGVYIWENLSASSFAAAAVQGYDHKKITQSMRDYALAGALHLDHFASIRQSPGNAHAMAGYSFHLGRAMGLTEIAVTEKLNRLVDQHESEWKTFLGSIGHNSFLNQWVLGKP